MSDTITIEAGDIVDFTFKIQQAILDGYRLSDQGDFAPQCIGFVYVTTMEKPMELPEMFNQIDKVEIDPQQLADLQVEIASIAEKINEGALTVEPNIVPPKQHRQTRGRK